MSDIITLSPNPRGFGLQGKLSALVAVVLGVALASADYTLGDSGLWRAASDGLLLGLAAAGLYDLTPGDAPRRAAQ